MAEVQHGRGYVYSIQYHIVWCVKYRHKVLLGDVDARLKEMLIQIARDNGFAITEIESDCDHVHLLIDCSPQHSIPSMIKALKGRISKVAVQRVSPAKKEAMGREPLESLLLCGNG